MQKFKVLMVAVLMVLAVAPAFAGTQWVTKEIAWEGLGAYVNTAADTTGITAVTDSNRTVMISTADWNWSALAQPASPNSVALVTVVATTFNNGASDSLYMFVEKGALGEVGMVHDAVSNGAAAVGNYMMKQPISTFGTGGIVFSGPLLADSDVAITLSNIWLTPEFRLNIFGDTTTKLHGCKVLLTYPKYVAD